MAGLKWLLELGAPPDETQEQRERRTSLLLNIYVAAPFVLLWTLVYAALGYPVAAAIPGGYFIVSLITLVYLDRTKRIRPVIALQLTLWLLLPFLLQWSLGGFVNASAVAIWAIGAPMMAMVFGMSPWSWFVGFAGLAVFSGLIDSTLAAATEPLPDGVITAFFVLNLTAVSFVIFVTLSLFVTELRRARAALEAEQERSERLLLNILPEHIAERLKEGEEPIADRIDQVTVLVADIAGFTPMSERVEAAEVVTMLNELFSRFDDLTVDLGLEKLKTIGDAYQAVGGLPGSNPDQVAAAADLALAMQEVVGTHSFPESGAIRVRIGIDTGPVVAGVIGKRKFSYDLWGDTINTASRMESHGVPGRAQVTEAVYRALRDRYEFEPRGVVEIKGKGELATYFLEGPSPSQALTTDSTSRASSSASNP